MISRERNENSEPRNRKYSWHRDKPKSSSMTFAELTDLYMGQQKEDLAPASFARLETLTAHLKEFFGSDSVVTTITHQSVREYVKLRKRYAAPGTIGHEVRLLRRLFALAKSTGEVDVNPTDQIKPPQYESRIQFLSGRDFQKVVDACPTWLRPIVELSVATGLTRAQLLHLRWQDIDADKGTITVPASRARGKKGRTIHLNSLAKQALDKAKLHSGSSAGLVFTDRAATPDNVSVAFRRTCRALGIEKVSFNDLRTTAANWILSSGAPIAAVSEFFAYSDPRTAMRYVKPCSDDLRVAMKPFEAIASKLKRKSAR